MVAAMAGATSSQPVVKISFAACVRAVQYMYSGSTCTAAVQYLYSYSTCSSTVQYGYSDSPPAGSATLSMAEAAAQFAEACLRGLAGEQVSSPA